MTGIDTAFSVQNSEIEALKATEREKTVLRLQAEKERWEKVLALMNQYGGVVSDADVAIVKNAITATNNEIEKAKQPRDLWDAMGINLDDDKKQAISESVSFALEQMSSILDAEIEMAQQAVDAANERVTAAQSALDAEMQAKANGLAYSQTEAEKRLEMEKQNQAKAIAEQKKAQKQKAQIETLQQISSLVTASAAIWGGPAVAGDSGHCDHVGDVRRGEDQSFTARQIVGYRAVRRRHLRIYRRRQSPERQRRSAGHQSQNGERTPCRRRGNVCRSEQVRSA